MELIILGRIPLKSYGYKYMELAAARPQTPQVGFIPKPFLHRRQELGQSLAGWC